jgi:phage terminase large subunit-like protein
MNLPEKLHNETTEKQLVESYHHLKLYSNWLKTARNKQKTPFGKWYIWLILAGRGWGKTKTGAQDIALYAIRNPNVQVAVITPTFGDIRRVAFGGVSGLLSIIPKECLLDGRGQGYNSASAEIRLNNGSKIYGFSATEPDRLRGPQFHRAWCDELASWQYPETFDQLMFGLRLGNDPKCIITTTPKPSKLIQDLIKRDDVYITKGSTFDNKDNLAPSALRMLEEKYSGTRLGRQELYAEVLTDVEGALWNYKDIEQTRIKKDELPNMERIVVSIDPAVTNKVTSDETGIIVAGKGVDNRYYILKDCSIKTTPEKWMRKAIDEYYIYEADRIIAEVNNGGDLVEKLLRTIDNDISYKAVRATRGKTVRAEPISALYEQKKVSHVGIFNELEEQLCSYTGGTKSPDRFDALVWALTELSTSSGKIYWRVN